MPRPKKLKPIPRFESEDAERQFWATAESSDYVDWSQGRRIAMPELKERVASELRR